MRTVAAPVQQSCRFLLLILGEPILYFVDAYSMCSSSTIKYSNSTKVCGLGRVSRYRLPESDLNCFHQLDPFSWAA